MFFSEIVSGPVVRPRARWPRASLRGIAYVLRWSGGVATLSSIMQASFPFCVRLAGGVHPWADSVLPRGSRWAECAPAPRDHRPDLVRCPLLFIQVSSLFAFLISFPIFCNGCNPTLPRAGLLPFWCSTGRGRASEGRRCSSPRSTVHRSFVFVLVAIFF